MQELGKFSVKINVIPNGLEKYMNFSINNKLRFINSVQFRGSSLDSLCRNEDFKYVRLKIFKYIYLIMTQ